MSGSVTINNARVTKGTITVPMYGPWSADLSVESVDALATSVTIAFQDLSLVGTVIRQATFAGERKVRIVGGAGGWRKTLKPRGYSLPFGVRSSSVIGDAASECGESVVVGSDVSLGAFYTRDEGKASRVLRIIAGGVWYIDNAGVTQVKDRETSAIATPFTVTKWDGGRGIFEIASENYADWTPGKTFTTNTVPDAQTISSVSFDVTNDGNVRLTVMTTDAYRERLLSDFRAIVRDELASVSFAGVYEYVIAANPINPGLSYTVDATPTDTRMPTLTKVPLATGVGSLSPPATGMKCRIRFVNSDPSRPEVVSFDGVTEHFMTAESTALLLYNFMYAMSLVAPAPAGMGLLIQPLITPAIIAAMAAQSVPAPPGLIPQIAAASALASGMVSGTVPSNTSTPFNAGLAPLAMKIPNVSGLFPGLGVPNG